jgi:hypothetical protein
VTLLLAVTLQEPIVVKILEPPERTLADVVVGALGLTGVIVVAALVLGVALAGVMFWIRSRSGEEPSA